MIIRYMLSVLMGIIALSNTVFPGDLDFYREMFDTYKSELHPRLIDRLPSQEKQKISQLEFVLVENPRLVTLAGTARDEKKIYISVGFIDGMFNYVDCLLLEGKLKNNNICENYFKYYFNEIMSNAKYPPLPVAEIILGNKPKLIKKWYNDTALNRVRTAMLFSALINVMVHEYGHHIVGFTRLGDNPTNKRILEGNVDKWSFSVLDRMGEKPALGAVISLGYISQIERYRRELREHFANNPDFDQPTRMHPWPKERAKWAFKHTCGDVSNNIALNNACKLLKRTIDRYE